MKIPTPLKMAVAGVALFSLGAGMTALVTGRVRLPAAGEQGRIEQVVHDYLLAHPEILAEMSTRLEVQQQANAEQDRNSALASMGSAALLDPKVAYVAGPANAKVTIAEFFDYRCPHCKASLPAMQHLLSAGKNVRIAFVERPILTPDSLWAAQAAVAARRQGDKYVPFHFALMATTGELTKDRILEVAKNVGLDAARLEKDMADPAVLDSIKQSNGLADRLHFDGTPTFVINGKIIVGELTDAQLQALTDAAAKS